jgi:hypothetical protein
MDKETEHKIMCVLEEQTTMRASEKFAGNIVKEEFHRGAIFGIKLIVDILFASKYSGEK